MNTWQDTKDKRIKKRSGSYYARFSKLGKRVEESLNTKNFELAKRLVDDIEGKILAGKSWRRSKDLFEDAWLEFMIDKKAGNKVKPARVKTLHEYAAFFERYYRPYFEGRTLSDFLDESLWKAFVENIRERHGEIQFDNIRKYLQGFFTWCVAHKRLDSKPYLYDPDAARKASREEFTPGKAYTIEELKRMRDAAWGRGPRFYLFMLMAQYMGMRPSEISQLHKSRIDLKYRRIVLRRVDTKTKKGREVPIHKIVMLALEQQMQAHPDSPFLFPNQRDKLRPMDPTGFKNHWAAVLKECGLEGRFYDFRHTFITNAIKNGVNPFTVGKMTGTSMPVIEKHYLHLVSDDYLLFIDNFEL